MGYIIAGLGNPGEDYTNTRHNTGRMIVEGLAKKSGADEFKDNPKAKALVVKGDIGKETVTFVLPNNFMNRSGGSIVPFIKSLKAAQKLIVVYDDLDVPMKNIF